MAQRADTVTDAAPARTSVIRIGTMRTTRYGPTALFSDVAGTGGGPGGVPR